VSRRKTKGSLHFAQIIFLLTNSSVLMWIQRFFHLPPSTSPFVLCFLPSAPKPPSPPSFSTKPNRPACQSSRIVALALLPPRSKHRRLPGSASPPPRPYHRHLHTWKNRSTASPVLCTISSASVVALSSYHQHEPMIQ
jgi:hypothetical protein